MALPEILIEKLRGSVRPVILSGAGMSQESGLATFRAPDDGLWSEYDPYELASPTGFRKNPQLVYDWYASRRAAALAAAPNAGHQAVADLAKYWPHLVLITQNVDGLHQAAGSQDVLELHGNIHGLRCQRCARPAQWPTPSGDVPRCAQCSGQLRPGVVWFGESLPEATLLLANAAIASCDLFISVGTSGSVYPAAEMIYEARDAGAFVVVVNPDVAARSIADCHILDTAANTFPAILAAVAGRLG